MLITFSGLDGAGKSTLIEWLRSTLEKQDKRVAVFHMNDHVGLYAYARFIRDKVIGGTGDSGARLTQGAEGSGDPLRSGRRGRLKAAAVRTRNAILWNKPLRRGIYLVDLFIFLFYRFYIEGLKKRILIMDRYFYDTLVDVADGRHWLGLRLLKLLTPTPSVPIFLDISPEESYARKGEYSVAYLKRRWAIYKEVFPWVRRSVVLANGDLHATMRALEKVLAERTAGR